MQDAKAAERKRYRRKMIATSILSVIFIVIGAMGLIGAVGESVIPSFLESVAIGAGIATGIHALTFLLKAARKLYIRALPIRLHGRYCHCDTCMDAENERFERERNGRSE